MKLEKAIQLNQESVRFLKGQNSHDHADAVKLGNEALKCIKEHRAKFDNTPYIHLPGETPEGESL